jgi:hypothetical protein
LKKEIKQIKEVVIAYGSIPTNTKTDNNSQVQSSGDSGASGTRRIACPNKESAGHTLVAAAIEYKGVAGDFEVC